MLHLNLTYLFTTLHFTWVFFFIILTFLNKIIFFILIFGIFLGQTKYQYFNGGYTVRRFGSKQASDTVDAIQMETPAEVSIIV